MRRVNVLYLGQEGVDPIWQEEVEAAVRPRHDLRILDPEQPLAGQFRDAEAVIDMGGSAGTHEMMDAAVDTKFWQVLGTGLDHVDVDYLKRKGFIVSNCPGPFSSMPLAESAMMLILMLAHRYREAAANFERRVLYNPMGHELGGKILGIIGFGASGRELARRAKPFGMRIRGIDVVRIPDEVLREIEPEFMGTPDDLDRVVAESDFLSLHLHLTRETRHLIDAQRIARMKPDACLINVARGALADEAALHAALEAGRLGGAGLDVFGQEPPDPSLPVYRLPNVVVTPHTAAATDGTARRRAAAAGENVDRLAQGLEPLYRVDR